MCKRCQSFQTIQGDSVWVQKERLLKEIRQNYKSVSVIYLIIIYRTFTSFFWSESFWKISQYFQIVISYQSCTYSPKVTVDLVFDVTNGKFNIVFNKYSELKINLEHIWKSVAKLRLTQK